MSEPINKKLYNSIVAEAKKKFLVYPSAYSSGWIISTYKKRGGKFKDDKDDKDEIKPLKRWYNEKWINACEYIKGNIVPCGRQEATFKNYPYCRPLIRINKDTPKTINEISISQIKKNCSQKKKKPISRVKV